MTTLLALCAAISLCASVQADLLVKLDSPKRVGDRAVVKLTLKNTFGERIESARATVFLFDDKGKMTGQTTRWVIGGKKDRPALAAGKETTFNFVITTDKPFKTHRITFTRLILEGGKSVDPTKNVQIQQSNGGP